MPIYEFECRECKRITTELVKLGTTWRYCRHCHWEGLESVNGEAWRVKAYRTKTVFNDALRHEVQALVQGVNVDLSEALNPEDD